MTAAHGALALFLAVLAGLWVCYLILSIDDTKEREEQWRDTHES